MKLPTWEECKAVVDAGEATALEKFIYKNEPSGRADIEFREDLRSLIIEVQNEVREPKSAKSENNSR